MKKHWFLFFFKRSISQRKGRIVIASASVTLAVAVVTGLGRPAFALPTFGSNCANCHDGNRGTILPISATGLVLPYFANATLGALL